MRTLNKIVLLAFIVLLVVSMVGCGSKKIEVRGITMDQAAMTVDEMNSIAKEFMAANPDIDVKITYVPYEAVHDKIVTAMAAPKPAYDVIMVDQPWYDEFIKAGYLADLTDKITPEMKSGIFQSGWNVVSRNGKVYGMPWLLDTKYLYYNKDMLAQAGFTAAPKTWEELVTQAQAIKTKGLAEFPLIWSWQQNESAICDFTALLYGNGGLFLDANGKPAFNNDKGVQVVEWMKKTIDDGLTNPASVTGKEADVQDNFSQGKAAFMLNWLSAFDVTNFDTTASGITGKVGMSTIPVFESTAGTLKSASVDGSTGFSVTATSPNIDAAYKWLTYLTSEPVQMKYSAHMLPVWQTAFEGDNLAALEKATKGGAVTAPMFALQFPFANLRPMVAYYNEASMALQVALQQSLTGQMAPKAALDAAAAKWLELAK